MVYKDKYYVHLEALQAAAATFCSKVGVDYDDGLGEAIVYGHI